MPEPRYPSAHAWKEEIIDGHRVRMPLSSPVCDFCGHDSPAWDYDCHDFIVIEDPELSSLGGFASCTPCSDMIEADDWNGVLERCVAGARSFGGEKAARIAHAAASLVHRYFRENRYGERQPWG